MLVNSVKTKKCIMVCGGGGVGKTTTAAALAIAATQFQKHVLVVTIDPAKRLAEALGFSSKTLEEGGAPLELSPEVSKKVGVTEGSKLSVGILNPKFVIDEVLKQSLTSEQAEKLKKTLLYSQMTEMIYGLQEYTAYEWVTRMLKLGTYDLIVLDTPPAFHAKDFFSAPDKISKLMESRVFQLFLPKKNWLSGLVSFSWLEKLLGERVYRESAMFFEIFGLLREQILDRCEMLKRFFQDQSVDVIAVSTLEKSAQIELEGLDRFLKEKNIRLNTIILNQVDEFRDGQSPELLASLDEPLRKKMNALNQWHEGRKAWVQSSISTIQVNYSDREVIVVPMSYVEDGFEILRRSSQALFSNT